MTSLRRHCSPPTVGTQPAVHWWNAYSPIGATPTRDEPPSELGRAARVVKSSGLFGELSSQELTPSHIHSRTRRHVARRQCP
jgi:hypothetical protein